MHSELFIKIEGITFVGFNESFKRGLSRWTVTDDATPVECGYGIVYLNNGSIETDIATYSLTGNYELTYTMTSDQFGNDTNGSGSLEFTIGSEYYVSDMTIGTFTYQFSMTGNHLTISCNGWTGGLGRISIRSLDSDYRQIDLYDDIDIPLTFNIADIQDFTKRNASSSKTITIPGTLNNNVVFKHLYNITTHLSLTLNKPISCYLVQDTLKIFEGSFELQKCMLNKNREISYEGLIYADNASLYARMGSKLMRGNDNFNDDIDFSEYSLAYSIDSMTQSYANANGSGVVYIPIDKQYRSVSSYNGDPRSFRISEMSPAVFVKEIWDKIFDKAGFTYTSTFLNSTYFKSLIYPQTDRYIRLSTDEQKSREWSGATGPSGYYSAVNLSLNVISRNETWNTLPWDTVYMGSRNQWSSSTFTAQTPGKYNIEIDYTFGMQLVVPNYNGQAQWNILCGVLNGFVPAFVDVINYIIVIRAANNQIEYYPGPNGSGKYTFASAETIYWDTRTQFTSHTFQRSLSNFYLETGDVVYHRMVIGIANKYTNGEAFWKYPNGSPASPVVYIAPQYASGYTTNENIFTITATNELCENDLLNPGIILHKVKQSDFISSIVKMFNLYIEPMSEKNMLIEPRNEYYLLNNNPTTILDWTSKVDTNMEISIERGSDLIDKIIDFRYDVDDDTTIADYNLANKDTYGTFYQLQEQAYNTTNPDKYNIKLLFAASSNAPIVDGSKIEVPRIYKVLDKATIAPWTDEGKEFKPRILHYGGLKSTGNNEIFSIKTWNGSQVKQYVGQFPYAGHFDDLYGSATKDLMFWYNTTYLSDIGSAVTPYNLINVYYKSMIDECLNKDYKLVKANIILFPKDMEKLHFYDLVFIDGVYYRLNRIINYIPGGKSVVELLTIQDQLIGWPTPDITTNPWGTDFDEYTDIIQKKKINPNNQYIDLLDSNFNADAKFEVDMIFTGWYEGTASNIDIDSISKDVTNFVDMVNYNDIEYLNGLEVEHTTIGNMKNNR
jgi:hypothetical protein